MAITENSRLRSVRELIEAIEEYLADRNANPKDGLTTVHPHCPQASPKRTYTKKHIKKTPERGQIENPKIIPKPLMKSDLFGFAEIWPDSSELL